MNIDIKTSFGDMELPAGFKQYGNNSPFCRIYFASNVLESTLNYGARWSTSFSELWPEVIVVYDNGRNPRVPTRAAESVASKKVVPILASAVKWAIDFLQEGQTAFLYGNRTANPFGEVPPGFSILAPKRSGNWELLGVIEKS